MGQFNSTGLVTGLPDADIPKHSAVKKTATGYAVAEPGDTVFGSALRHGYAETPDVGQECISIKMKNAPGTHFAIAAGVIADGDGIGVAAGGTVATGGTDGIAMEAGVAGQIIEVAYGI